MTLVPRTTDHARSSGPAPRRATPGIVPAPDANRSVGLLHQIEPASLTRRELAALRASDYGHVAVGALAESEVHLPGEDPGHMARVTESVRRDGVLSPLVVRVRPDGVLLLLDGHHRAVAVLRQRLARRVPVLLVTCPCTMGCAFTADLLAEQRERSAAEGWGS